MIEPLGDVTVEDLQTQSGRTIRFHAEAPGHGLPTVAVLDYRERYQRIPRGWLRDRYFYDYRPEPTPSRKAHHDHPPRGVHQHCREATGSQARSQYEDWPRLLEEVHEAFTSVYVRSASIDCGGLRPLT